MQRSSSCPGATGGRAPGSESLGSRGGRGADRPGSGRHPSEEAARNGVVDDGVPPGGPPEESLGAACVFRVGGTRHRGRPWQDVELCSGALVVFGRENRLAHHGVPALLPDRDVPDLGLPAGRRINITMRVSGL